LAALILKPREERDTLLVRWLKRAYLPTLVWSLAHKKTVVVGALALLVAAISLFPYLGKEFMPQLREGTIMWRVTAIPSTSLDESIQLSEKLEKALLKFPEVRTALSTIGRAEKGEATDVNYQEVMTDLKPRDQWGTGRSYMELADAMQKRLRKIAPTAIITFTQPIQMRVEELISGVRAALVAKLYGPDLGTLQRLSTDIKNTIAKVPGVVDLSLEANKGKPQIRIEVDREALARYGMNADDVLSVVRTGIGDQPVTTLVQGVKRFAITARLNKDSRQSVDAISNIPLRTPGGAIIPLSRVAKVSVSSGYSFIRREQLQRYAVIQMDVRGRDVNGFVKEANARIHKDIKLPQGYWLQWGGSFENQRRAMKRLSIIVPVTIFFIFVLLYTAFNSVKYAALIIANIPFAIIGGVFSLWVTGQYLSVPSAIGFIAVFGVAMLNGIVLVSFINDRRAQGDSVREAVRSGAEMRLRPVLITASVAILGLIPMLLSQGVGAETQRPLATVVIGGLFTSTLLTLILLPIFYEWVEGRGKNDAEGE
ncbi:MAG TPA: efflux RND transporter permease subunit, partial [Gammaproteobacteria bacterium]|nr:efflux RND transporter permease subunit [Gammaproteobacteria bacterium]